MISGGKTIMDTKPDWGSFNYTWTCVIVFIICFGMTAIKDLKIFVRINSYGVIFISLIICIIIGMGIYGFSNTEYVYNQDSFDKHVADTGNKPYEAFVAIFGTNYAVLMGILGGGYYFHNLSLPVIRNAKNPENNERDVFYGYFLVFLTYCFAGVLGYYGFLGDVFTDQKPSIDGIEQNCSVMFKTASIVGTLMRVFAFVQLLTVNSLIFACERS